MGEWTVLHISTSFFLPLLRLSFLCFVLLFIYQELCFRYCLSIRIRSKGLALCHGLWLQVCPGYFRVWVVTDEAFSLFLDPGRKKKSEDKQAKVKFSEAHTYDNTHAYNHSLSTFTSVFSRSFHSTTLIRVSIVDECTLSRKYRWHLSEIQTQRANTVLFSFSLHKRTGCLKQISNGRVEGEYICQ